MTNDNDERGSSRSTRSQMTNDSPQDTGDVADEGQLASDYQDEAGDEKMETLDNPRRFPDDGPSDVEKESWTPEELPEIDDVGTETDNGSRPFDEMSTIPATERDTIRMEVTVDVSDMDDKDKEAIKNLARLYEGAFQEVVNKNRDYSFSFLRTGQKLAETPAVPFDDPARAQAFGLLTRIGDKHERLIENVYGNGDASVSDTPDVTAQEMANYAMFLALVLRYPDLCTEL